MFKAGLVVEKWGDGAGERLGGGGGGMMEGVEG